MEVSLGTAGKDRVVLTMETDYPRSGNIRLMINEIDGFEGCISLRRPDWCSSVLVIINGERERVLATENGYIKIARDWNAGDVIEMDLSMEPVFMESNPRVDATRSSVCIQYGPIVYCLENHDQKDNSSLLDVRIDTRKPIKPVWRENLLGGLLTMELPGYVVQMEPWENRLYLPVSRVSGLGRKEIKLVAIPYYAWGNRGISSMRVWVPKAD